MKKPTILKTLIAVVFLLLSFSSHAQLRKGFTTRYTTSLNGDILVIGNNSLNRDGGRRERPNVNYDDQGSGSEVNDNFDMKYIDIDSETSFNSSSATLKIPDASKTCFEIVYAALYWSGTYQGTDRSKINHVRLKTPTATTYKALTGSILWDEGGTGVNSAYGSLPYACFVDITDDVKAAKEGVYTIADVMCSEGKFSPGGNSAGWSIFVIYKDPLLPSKYITSFDGFSIIRSSDPPLDIPISGFRTNPFGNVNVKLAFSALEGDNKLEGDGLQIIGGKASSVWGAISSLVRPITAGTPPKPNFFNSTITDGDVILAGRTPSSKNTLGYDAGVVTLDNSVGGVQNSVIQNDETSATLRINTSQDSYFMFFNALSVEIIAPKIVLKKNVLSDKDVNIGSQPVTLNQELRYEIKFKNEGNDNAKNFTITDVIPNNVIFNGISDILVMDTRITATYTAATRTLVFSIPDELVIAKGAEFTLKFKVKVVDDCNELIDACSNEIKNTAVSKYYGDKNTTPGGFGEGSYSTISSCNVGEPTSTNFLVGIDECLFSRDVSLCGTAVLTAANGYSTYVWRDPNGVIFGGNNRQVTIDKPGTYTVNNSGAANCEDIQQKFVVIDYLASANKNPIKGDNIDPATGLAYGCVRDNKPFPKIFLCGLNDKRFIDTQITGATSITWQETKDVTPSTNPDSCPYEGATNWTTVENGPTFTADRAGVFRLVINYGNNTCVATHYFNVYQNLLDPTVKKQDIVCNTKGSITVTNPLPNTGYVYSLDGTNYQPSNIFNDVAKGSYTVQIKQTVLEVGQVSACIFKIDVNVEQLDFTTDLEATHPLCNGEQGTIKATINNVPGQYNFILRKKGSTVEIQNSGLINNNIITFNGVDPGVYEVLMSTANNGCSVIKEIEVYDYRLTAVANITKTPTACSDGEITVSVTGGTPRPGPPPYYLYYVNGSTNFVTDPKIPVTRPLPASGEYNIVVVDANGCTVNVLPVKVTELPKPKVTFKADNINCYGSNSGVINVDITPGDSGYAVSYSVNGGGFSSIAPITNLAVGNYSIVVKYTYNGVECLDPAVNVTIDGPDAALTASAGVSELAGCGPAGFEHQGKIRITNVEGGTPGYTYSFDDQKTWSPINEALVNPGTYTVYVKDNAGCIYAMSGIVLDPKPADPSIEPDPKIVYNCDGTGIATVVVNNTGGANYTYEYYIDGTANTPITSNVFNNVRTGTHVISIKYKLVGATTYSNLLKEDFGNGVDAKSPGINVNYCWEKQDYVTECGAGLWHDYLLNDGEYVVTKGILEDHRNDFGWVIPKDHTNPGSIDGRYLAVNIGKTAGEGGILYRKTIYDIIPNQDIKVQFYALNLLLQANQKIKPNLTVELHKNGVLIPGASVNTADILQNESWNFLDKLSINPGNNTSLEFVIRSNSDREDGNDLAIDDILVYQMPKSCLSEKKIDIIIDSNKAFNVLEPEIQNVACSGGNTGAIKITAQNFDTTNGFQYSINGGTWKTSTVSPVTEGGLIAGTYTVDVRSDATGTCTKSFRKTIGSGTPVTVTASVTAPLTCTLKATITAVADGGTGPYKYELRGADGVAVLVAFQDLATFPNILKGSYTVVAQDINGCPSGASTVVVVDDPIPPTASLADTSDLCFNSDKATIVVTASGTGTLSYSLDGAPGVGSNTFANVGVGTHTVVVTDSNGCKATVSNIIVAEELTGKAKVTKTLDCDTVGATIKVDIEGGKTTFTYRVKEGSNLYGPIVPVTGTTFNYTAPAAGIYTFEISDSNSPTACKAEVTATVNSITKPTVIATPVQVACYNASTGEVTLTASGGSLSYTYSFNNSLFTNTVKYTGLKAGIPYSYQVKDTNGCTSDIGSITLTQPTAVDGTISATEITCGTTGVVPAVVTIEGKGGKADYTYSFNGNTNYTTTNTFPTSTGGTITAYVKDANGCEAGPFSIEVLALKQMGGITITDNGYDCSTTPPGGHVNIAAIKNGVSAPIRYQIISGPAGYNTATNADGEFKSLTPGLYTFQATDEKTGCFVTQPYTVKGAPDIVAGGSVVTTIKCYGGTGKIQFTVTGVKSRYDYVVRDALNNSIQSGNNIVSTNTTVTVSAALAAGTYTITAKDRTTNCEAVYSVTLSQPANPLDVTATAPNVNCNKYTVFITAEGKDGTPSYTYAVVEHNATAPTVFDADPKLSVNTANGTKLSWDVYVKDANGCTDFVNVNIIKDQVPSVTATLDNQCTGSGNKFRITATGTGGTGTLEYGINGVNGAFSTNNVFDVAASATPYTVWVRDANLCTASATPITVYSQLTATKVVKELDCSPTKDATITITASGGKTPYKYEVSSNGGTTYGPMATNVYTTSTAGTFLIKITDDNNCSFVESTTILSISNPTVTIVTQANVKCNGGSDGSVKLIGHGGSGGFTYSNNAASGFSNVDTFSGLAAGDHTFYVKDSKGCTGSIIVTITQPTKLVATASAPAFTCNTSNVKQSTTVTIAVPTTGTGPYEYSFNGGGYSTTVRTLVVSDNGTDQTINFSVRDKNLCVFSDSVILSKLNPPAITSVQPSVVTCLATTSTAVVNVTTGTGVGALQYETIAPSPIIRGKQTSNSFANLTPGDYFFKVTDANGCFDTESITIKAVTNIAINGITNNDVKCKGTSTGNGTYTVSNIATVGDYTFLLTAGNLGSGTLTKSNNTLSLNNVAVGSYTVQVTDNATGCFRSATIVIAEPANNVDVTALATKINCNDDVATITAAGAGGTATYKYAVVEHNATAPTTFAAGEILTVDTAGGTKMEWDVYVQDANGCTDFVSVLIDTDPTPTVTATLDNQCTASGSNFRITATGLNGVAPLKYGINGVNGAFGTLNTFDVAARATPYIVWVKDANGCTAQAAAIMVYPQLTALAKVTKPLDCTLSPKAQITVDITGGKSTYTYKVDSGSGYGASNPVSGNQFVFDAPAAGVYKFEITDSNSPACKIEASATVMAISNPTVAAVNQVNITCFGANNGSVKLKGSGGSGSGYTYSKDGVTYSIVDTFNGLTPGLHTFYVKDGKECPAQVDVTILEPSALTTTASAAPFSCNPTTNAKQSTTVTIVPPTTGTAPYEYSFNGTSYDALIKTLTVHDNGSDQVITFYVRDKNLCVYSNTVTIAKLNPPVIFSAVPTPVTCTATKSTVTVTTTTGTGVGNLVYSITAPAAYVTTNTDGIFANLDPNNTYTFKVVDENGCFDTETLKVNAVTPILVTPSKISDVKCKGDTTGIAKYTISGFSATANYDVTVTTVPAGLSSTLTQVGDVITLTNLKAGAYTLSVVDKTTNCPADATVTILEPLRALEASYVAVNANCKVGTSKVTVTALYGTSPYKYSFVQDNAVIGTLTNVASANLDPNVATEWDVYVVDANGCQVKLDVTIEKDDAPTVTATAAGQCLGNGTYTITAVGLGKAPLTYSITNATTGFGTSNTFVVAASGNYNVWVKDGNGCVAQTTAPVTVLDALTISAKLDKNITCVPGSVDAKITLTVTGGSGSYAYSYTSTPATATGTFSGNVFTPDLSGLVLPATAADFVFTVTDTSTLPIADRCKATTTVPVHITIPVPPHFTMVEGPKISCNGDESGSLNITIDPTKGLAPFVIKVYNNDIPKDYGTQTSGLAAGNYTVTITDAKGCSYEEDIEIKQPDPIVVDYDTTPMQCVGAGVSKGEIIIKSVKGGTANYDYYVTGINGYNKEVHGIPGTTVVFEVVDFGLYQIRVVDKNGCSNIISDVLIAAPVDELDVEIDTASTCAATGGSATITIKTAFAGDGPYHFNIYKGPTPPQIWTADGVDGWQGETSTKETIYTGLTPGVKYTFIIYDEDTKCYYYQVAPDPVPTNSTLTVENKVASNITCTTENDGNVTFNIKNIYTSSVDVSYQVYESLTNKAIGTAVNLTIGASTSSPSQNVGPLSVGTYYILVREVAGPNSGCAVASTTFNIKKSPILLSLTASATSIADCTNLGKISAQAKDGTGPYTYQVVPVGTAYVDTDWVPGSTFTRPGSVAGITYDVYAKDDYGCIKFVPVTVYKYEVPTIDPIDPICYDGKTPFTFNIVGTVDPAIVGGATYSVNSGDFQASPSFTFNAAGTYNFVIKDGKGCTATTSVEVKPILKLDAVLTKELDCSVTDINSSKAIITLTASGGYGTTYSYEYSTDGGSNWTTMTPTLQADGVTVLPDNVLQTNVPGDYIFRATDEGNTTTCQVTKEFTLDPIPAIVFTVAETNITCPGGSDGTITVDVTAGVGPFEYQLEKGGAVIVGFNPSNEFTGLADGNDYVVTVRDAKLCFATENATITIPAPLVATAVLDKKLACNTDNSTINAEIIVTVTSGGTTPYQYSFDNGTNFSDDNKYTTSDSGPVTIIVKDGNGCETTLPVVPIPALNAPSGMNISGTPIYCLPAASQKSTVTINSVTGGVFDAANPLQYEILSPVVVGKQTSTVFADLDPSTEPYVFQVTDMNGCTYRDSFKVDPVVSITVSSDLITNVSCIGLNDGAVKFTVANYGTHAYTAVLTTGTGTLTKVGNIVTATDLVAGTYVLQVTDDITQCTSSATMVVSEPTALSLAPDLNLHADCDSDAVVSVIASGGTGPYEYSFVVAGSGSGGTYTTDSEVSLDPTTSTNWEVWVRDAHNCIISVPLDITIVKDPSPTVAMPAPICFEGVPVNIDLSIGQSFGTGLGPVTYKINNATQSNPIYAITAPGLYDISIIDKNGCESNVVTYEVKPQLELDAKVTRDLSCIVGSEDAQFELTASNGHGTYVYSYTLDGGASVPMTLNTLTNSASGTYVFKVTDAENCEATYTIVVDPITPIAFTVAETAVSCKGDSTGMISVSVTSGNGPYEYQLEDGATIVTPYQSLPQFTGLPAKNTYVVRVRDAKMCNNTMPATITEPVDDLTAISDITTKLECTSGNVPSLAVVTVTPSGGTTPYQYSYDGGVNYSGDNTYETTAGITFDVYVKDKNGCIFIFPNGVDVPALTPPTGFGFNLVQAVTCTKDATVDVVNVLGGALPLQYETIAPSPVIKGKQLSATFTDLTPGFYVFQVTDNNGCTRKESLTISPVNNITVGGKLVKNVSCNGLSDGSIEFKVENLAGGYTATLNSALGTLVKSGNIVTVTNLPAGSYTLTVTDAITDCVNTATIVVGEPAVLGLSLVSQTAANCYLGAVVTVKGTGGSPLYKYAFVRNNVTPTASDFTDSDFAVLDFTLDKDWDVYVQDKNLICSAKIDVEITIDDLPTIDINKNIYCYTGGPVAIEITGTTDDDIVAPPMYSIGNGYYASPFFTLNAPGTYEFFIKDGNGCLAKATYVLRQELLIEATLTQDLNCTTNDATITLSASQGTGAGTYSFEYDFNNSGIFTAVPTLPYKPTAAGTYTFRVKDAQCSTVSVPVIVTPLTIPKFTVDTVNVRCEGDLNGSIEVTAKDGVAPYQYSITDGATTSPLQASNLFTGLKAGTYTINVVDSKNCPATSAPVTITEPTKLTASHVVSPFGCDTSNTAKDAVITLTAHDGTGPYSYSFDNGLTFGDSPSHTVNTANTVSYVIVDINGCRAIGTATVPVYNPPTKFDLAATPIYCNNAAGTATVTVSNITGGEPGYTYAIIEPVGSATSNTLGSFDNLLPATYVIKVTDDNGCSTLNSIEVKKASEVNVEAQLLSDVACNGGTTGSIAFTISNYITPANYTFALSPNNGTFTQSGDVVTFTGLTAANYTFTVTDVTSGCTDSVANFLVNQPSAPLSFTMTATNISCDNKNATIIVNAVGGTLDYSYAAVVSGQPAPTAYSLSNKLEVDTNNGTSWDVYVKDFNGCTTLVQTQNILTDALPSAITANVTSLCPSATGTYEIVVSATGKAPLEYSIGSGFQSSPSFEVNSSGSYDVTVKDGNGCTVTVTAAVVIDGALDLQLDIQALPSCDAPDGRIFAKATGGSGNYRYSSGAYVPVTGATATFNNVSYGSHTVVVTDLTTGCKDTVIVELSKATEITGLALDKTDVTCNGGSNGRIIVNLAPNAPGVNDNPIYRYTLTGTAIGNVPVSVGPQDSNIFDNLLPGDYTVRVTSGRGCNAQVDTRITQPTPIVVNAPTITPFSCTAGTNTTNFASITVNSVTGGTNPYVLYVFSKNGTVVQSSDSNVYNETDLAGGSYSVKVFDSKGCEGSSTAPIVIAPFITMNDINVTVVTPITCINNETIQVSVATTGGTPTALVYTLTGANGTVFNQTNPTGLFSGLAIGNYAITVFNPTTGCTIKDFHYIFDPNTFAIEVAPVKGEVCYGDSDGSVDLTFVDNQLNPTNDAGAFTYTITGPVPSSGTTTNAGPIRILGLTAGQYSVTAKLVNRPECTVTTVFTINQPAAALMIAKTQGPITCVAGNNDGAITVSASGGWDTNYLYELVGPVNVAYSTQYEFKGLTAGNYTINVKDGKGCIATTTAQLVNPTPIVVNATASATMLTCFDNEDGVVTVDVVTGGSGNYTYTLNGVLADGTVIVVESQGTKQFTGLKAGTYTVTVKDTWGCENISNTVVIDQPTEVKAELTIARNETCQLVPILKITATGGKAPYYYSADGTNYSVSFNSSIDITLPKTTVKTAYKYFVKDSNNCTSTISNTVEVPTVPKLDFTSLVDVDIKCKGSAEGTITAIATGGLGNYIYTLQDAAGVDITPAPTQLTPGVFTGLAVGNYRVKLESSDCSVTSAPIEISQPNVELSAVAIPTDVTCNGFNNGKITVNAAGGTGVYKYAIEPEFRQFFDKNVFENLKPGFYDVLVQDENECYIFIKDVEVKEPAPLTAALVDGTLFPETCAGEKDGSFSIIISGGTIDYSVSLDSETGPFTQGAVGQTTFDFDNLSGGPHIVYFVDASGCNGQVDIAMDEAVTLNPTNVVSYDCVNNTAANMVTVDAGYDGDPAEIDYRLDGGQPQMNNIFTNLAPGKHTIKVTHTNGCNADTSFEILAVEKLDITVIEEPGVWNTLIASAVGGGGDYMYSIDGGSFSHENKFIIYKTGTYTITVMDKNGCTDSQEYYIEYVDVCLDNYFTPAGSTNTAWGPGCTNIYTNLIFSIFDRYGREIAKYHYGQKWDGRYNGEELPSGDYWYVLKLNDEKDAREFVGHFTLYR
ncbi:T9SS type B sorting domain-containing protein [Flavobacterium saccharophilum]|uniref:Gliding motility-associated C-terminal domain-containing protein n=1 Tax=Flavobacterium saccharophilum TaxID=29534 RepID=A0A1M6ZVU0_9FLAO|nr:T9SS type B sorting domain-containing protein [Flavobacterium saccharophilum]SHL34465.1 gliding motility-associated C-terminal domain-containing protein [Flavobacterium saccharophilum]